MGGTRGGEVIEREPAATRSLTTTVLDGADAIRPHIEAWIACLEQSPRPRFDAHPEHVLRTIDDVAGRELLTVLVHDGDDLVAVAPLQVHPTVVPWSVRGRRARRSVLRFGVRTATLMCESFIGPEDPEVFAVLLAAVVDACRGIEVVDFRHVATDTPLWELLSSPGRVAAGRSAWRPNLVGIKRLVSPGDDYEAFISQRLTKKARANVRREWRMLQAQAPGAVRVEVTTRPDEVVAYLEAAADVFAHSWHHAQGASPLLADERRIDQLRFMAEHGWLRSHVLWVGDLPVAYALGYESYGTLLLLRLAHREDWNHRSPGKALVHRILADVCEQPGIDTLDFGHGDWAYKRTLSTSVRHASDARLIERRPRALLVYSGPRAWSSVRRWGLGTLERSGRLDQILRWTRKHLPR